MTTRVLVYIVAAAIPLLVANGVNSIPLAAWIAPILLLRISRDLRSAISVPIVFLLLASAFAFQFRGMFPVTGVAYVLFLTLFGSIAALPYIIDRVSIHRFRGIAGTLIFPLTWAAVETMSAYGPTASWGAVAYSQYGNLPLLQLLSVTGMAGIAFLIGWTATIVNYVWERGLGTQKVRRYSILWGCVVLATVLGGGLRISEFPPDSNTVRVASIVGKEVDSTMWEIIGRLQHHEATPSDITEIRDWSNSATTDLIERSEIEAKAGARIIAWSEASAVLLKEDEVALLSKGRALAAEYGIYLAMGVLVWDRDAERPAENKVIMIGPDGEIEWESMKARPVPGPEAALSAQGDGVLKVSDTSYGRLAAVVCFDADFPNLLFQAGVLDVDILIVPSNDWSAITPWHAQMSSYRGIEQGFQVVRPTSNGMSVAFDYQGRQLGASNHFLADDSTMVVQVPTEGVHTWYARSGNVFGWLCLVMLGVLLITAFRSQRPSD